MYNNISMLSRQQIAYLCKQHNAFEPVTANLNPDLYNIFTQNSILKAILMYKCLINTTYTLTN